MVCTFAIGSLQSTSCISYLLLLADFRGNMVRLFEGKEIDVGQMSALDYLFHLQ